MCKHFSGLAAAVAYNDSPESASLSPAFDPNPKKTFSDDLVQETLFGSRSTPLPLLRQLNSYSDNRA